MIFKACHDEKWGYPDVIHLYNNGGTLIGTAAATVEIPPHAAVSRFGSLNLGLHVETVHAQAKQPEVRIQQLR